MLTRDRIASRKGAKGAKEIRSVLATRVRDADVRCPWRDAEFRFGLRRHGRSDLECHTRVASSHRPELRSPPPKAES